MADEDEVKLAKEEEEEIEEGDAAGGDAAKKKKKKKKKKGGGGGDEAGDDAGGEAAAMVEAAAPAAAPAGDADGADDDADGAAGGERSEAQKKRYKKKAAAARKKAAAESGEGDGTMPIFDVKHTWSTELRGIKPWGSWPTPGKGGKPQTTPPSVPVADQFPDGELPHGVEMEYEGDNRYRTTKAELRELERLHNISYNEVRTAAECHRQVRKHMESVIKPGILMQDM